MAGIDIARRLVAPQGARFGRHYMPWLGICQLDKHLWAWYDYIKTMYIRKDIAMDYGLAVADAELGWLDRALDQTPKEPFPEEVVETARVCDTG